VFDTYPIDNPDIASELQLLEAIGPDVPKSALLRLVRAFAELRVAQDEARLNYPYSTRELIAIVRHLQRYPDQSISSALLNVLGFDHWDANVAKLLVHTFKKYGIGIEELLPSHLRSKDGRPDDYNSASVWDRALWEMKNAVKLSQVFSLPNPELTSTWTLSEGNQAKAVMNDKYSGRVAILDPPTSEALQDWNFTRSKEFSELLQSFKLPIASHNRVVASTASADGGFYFLLDRSAAILAVRDPLSPSLDAGEVKLMPHSGLPFFGGFGREEEPVVMHQGQPLSFTRPTMSFAAGYLVVVMPVDNALVLIRDPLAVPRGEGPEAEVIRMELPAQGGNWPWKSNQATPADRFVLIPSDPKSQASGLEGGLPVFRPENCVCLVSPGRKQLTQIDVEHRISRTVALPAGVRAVSTSPLVEEGAVEGLEVFVTGDSATRQSTVLRLPCAWDKQSGDTVDLQNIETGASAVATQWNETSMEFLDTATPSFGSSVVMTGAGDVPVSSLLGPATGENGASLTVRERVPEAQIALGSGALSLCRPVVGRSGGRFAEWVDLKKQMVAQLPVDSPEEDLGEVVRILRYKDPVDDMPSVAVVFATGQVVCLQLDGEALASALRSYMELRGLGEMLPKKGQAPEDARDLIKRVEEQATSARQEAERRRQEFQREKDREATSPKEGDHDDKEHVGGNKWAGGTGGADTAGLGGKGGPYRLDKGFDVHQISDEAKKNISKEALEAARKMGQEALKKKLEEIEMGARDWDLYSRLRAGVESHINALRQVLQSADAKQQERVWVKGMEGELDDSRIVDAIAGETHVFRRRADPAASNVMMHPKRISFVFDVSASMYRFNGLDGRLTRTLECALLMMEALKGTEHKYVYEISGHSGESHHHPFVEFGNPPKNEKEQLAVLQRMYAMSQYCMSGDNTLLALREASTRVVSSGAADDYFVFAFSDANLSQYGIRTEAVSKALTHNPQVCPSFFLIASFEDEAKKLVESLPAGRAVLAMDLRNLPNQMKAIFQSSVLRQG